MIGAESIWLRVGSSRWLNAWQLAVGLLASAVLLASPMRAGWMVVLLCVISLVHVGCARGQNPARRVTGMWLQAGGNATLFSPAGRLQARQRSGGWASRWCCIVSMETADGGRRLRCLVCRSRNTPDAYRRLLVRLRWSQVSRPDHAVRWV